MLELDAYTLMNWNDLDPSDCSEAIDFLLEASRADFKPSDAFPYQEYERQQLPFVYDQLKLR